MNRVVKMHCYFNKTFHEFKVLKKVFITETINVDFHNKFTNYELFCFSIFLHIYIYVCVYVCVCMFVCVCEEK